jgi:hypothetical protein
MSVHLILRHHCRLNRPLVGQLAAFIAGLESRLIGQLAASRPTSIVVSLDDLRHHCRLNRPLVGRLATFTANLDRWLIGQIAASRPTPIVVS